MVRTSMHGPLSKRFCLVRTLARMTLRTHSRCAPRNVQEDKTRTAAALRIDPQCCAPSAYSPPHARRPNPDRNSRRVPEVPCDALRALSARSPTARCARFFVCASQFEDSRFCVRADIRAVARCGNQRISTAAIRGAFVDMHRIRICCAGRINTLDPTNRTGLWRQQKEAAHER